MGSRKLRLQQSCWAEPCQEAAQPAELGRRKGDGFEGYRLITWLREGETPPLGLHFVLLLPGIMRKLISSKQTKPGFPEVQAGMEINLQIPDGSGSFHMPPSSPKTILKMLVL